MKQNFRYEGEYESQKKQHKQETIEYILDKDYGTTLTYSELGKILHYNINDEEEFKKYRSMMGIIKNFLLQYGYVLKGIGGIGYYILKPTQISQHCFRTYIKSASRLYDKSAYVLDRADKTQMNEIRLEEINNMMTLNKKLIDETDKMIIESPYYSRKDYYDSLED